MTASGPTRHSCVVCCDFGTVINPDGHGTAPCPQDCPAARRLAALERLAHLQPTDFTMEQLAGSQCVLCGATPRWATPIRHVGGVEVFACYPACDGFQDRDMR